MNMNPAITTVLVGIALLLITPFFVHAESIVWSGNLGRLPFLSARWTKARTDRGWMSNIQVSVRYNVKVTDGNGATVACGSRVPHGTKLKFTIVNHQYTDVSWFAAGNFSDSPYGSWVADAGRPSAMCSTRANMIASTADGDRTFAHYTVAPPTTSISGLQGNECTGTSKTQNCTMTKEGTTNVSFNFAATQGYMYGAHGRNGSWSCWAGPARPNTGARCNPAGCEKNVQPPTAIPARAINCPITVAAAPEVPTTPPSSPSLTTAGASACVTGQAYAISMTANDPDDDRVRYLVDWNNDVDADQFVPSSGYVNSGTVQNVSRAFSTPGSKTVRVRAQDDKGALSPWASTMFMCSGEATSANAILDGENGAIIGDDSGAGNFPSSNDLSLKALPSLVRTGQTTKVHWSSQNMTSCTVAGSNGDSWDGLNSPVSGETSGAISGSVTYTLTCRAGGETFTKRALVNVLPSWVEK